MFTCGSTLIVSSGGGGVCLLAPRGEGKKGEGRSPLLLPSVVYGLSGLDVYPAAGRFSVLCGCTESVL